MRVVLDTNILARAHKNATGPARECLRELETQRHRLLVSSYLLAELARVLAYRRLMALHKLSVDEIREFLAAIETVGEAVATPLDAAEAIVSADPDDDPIVQLAISGHAEVLCILDRHLRTAEVQAHCQSNGIRIMTDVELLPLLRAEHE
jgi:putative PIN family toxin of toxin-antitoxin system